MSVEITLCTNSKTFKYKLKLNIISNYIQVGCDIFWTANVGTVGINGLKKLEDWCPEKTSKSLGSHALEVEPTLPYKHKFKFTQSNEGTCNTLLLIS